MYVDRPVREVCLVFAKVAIVAVVLVRVGSAVGMPSLAPLGVAVTFLFTALFMADRRGGAERFGITLGGVLAARDDDDAPKAAFSEDSVVGAGRTRVAIAREAARSALRETTFAALVCLVIFPPFVLAYIRWFGLDGRYVFAPPNELASVIATQILLVALPEEAFFRGYVQTRLSDAWPPIRSLLGAPVAAPALFLQAFLFAILHYVVEPIPDRLAVFFPALLFGWLRARRGGIGAALLFHAACNVYSELLLRSLY